MSARPLTSSRPGAGSRRRRVRARQWTARSGRSFSRSRSAGTPAAASVRAQAGSERRGAARRSPTRSLMASSEKGAVPAVALTAPSVPAPEPTDPELEVVRAPDQVQHAEAGDHAAQHGAQPVDARGVPGDLRPDAVPRAAPRPEQEEDPHLQAVDDEQEGEQGRAGPHRGGDLNATPDAALGDCAPASA